jgi:hypothetical protein
MAFLTTATSPAAWRGDLLAAAACLRASSAHSTTPAEMYNQIVASTG